MRALCHSVLHSKSSAADGLSFCFCLFPWHVSSLFVCLLQVISFFLPFFFFFFLGLIFPPISGHVIRDRHSVNCVCIIIVLCFFISSFVSCGNPVFCLIATSGLMTRDALLVICVTMVPKGEICDEISRRHVPVKLRRISIAKLREKERTQRDGLYASEDGTDLLQDFALLVSSRFLL